RVVVEVRLLDGAVLDRDAPLERRGQAEYDRAFDLRLHLVRIHDRAAVDRRDDAIYLDHMILDGDFGDFGNNRAERLVHRDTLENTRMLSAPAGFLRGEIEHRQVARTVSQQPTPELIRIFFTGVRELVDEPFDDERILRVTDAAPEPERHAGVVEHVRD